jgi:peptide/nickel transport system permease protein
MAAPVADIAAIGGSDERSVAPTRDDGRRGRRRQLAAQLQLWLPLSFLVLMILTCFVWPIIYTIPPPIFGSLAHPLLPPLSPHHIFGTDQLGNDVFSRIVYGGRVSLEVGFGTMVISMAIGGMIGSLAAFKGGAVDAVLMRLIEVLLAFPSIALVLVVATYLRPNELHVIWAISFFGIPAFARIARANTLRLREQTFIAAAKLSGSHDARILTRHIIPNIFFPLLTFGLLGVGIAMIIEAALSFLGLGIPPPGPSWGNMIAGGEQSIQATPDLVIIPCAFLFATVLAVNLLGDALRARWGVR